MSNIKRGKLSAAVERVLQALDDQTLTRAEIEALRARLGLAGPVCELPGPPSSDPVFAPGDPAPHEDATGRSRWPFPEEACRCEFGWQPECPQHGTGTAGSLDD
jgi:hypothetical protein